MLGVPGCSFNMSSDSVHSVVEHLFRREAGKLSASLARIYGMSRLETVDDLVQEALLSALVDWQHRGVPENPTAWLHRVARNKAIDRIRRGRLERETTIELVPGLREASLTVQLEHSMDAGEIEDSQLRMMFACCHPDLPMESQIALTLKTLCGFSVREIASAFFEKESTIEKRLGRARAFFRDRHIELDLPASESLEPRTESVLHCLYLLFNEGYKSSESESLLQRDLCLEALRLALLVTEHPSVTSPGSHALVALMSFLAARFEARANEFGEIVLLPDQDRSKWDRTLIERGFEHFDESRFDERATPYHLEAAIQAVHMSTPHATETNWPAILGLYKRLFEISQSPIVALHMSVSMSYVHGAAAALALLRENPLHEYYLYHAITAHLQASLGSVDEAKQAYARAIELTRNARERVLLLSRLIELEGIVDGAAVNTDVVSA
jgi:RNA polymerase sigma factor (sigma-70 family)